MAKQLILRGCKKRYLKGRLVLTDAVKALSPKGRNAIQVRRLA